MAKKSKVSKKAPAKKEAAEEAAFTVKDLAEELDLAPASVRVKLRAAGITPNGKSYGWDTQKEFDAVVKKLTSTKKASKEEEAEEEDDDGEEEEAPKPKKKARSKKK